MLIRSSMLAVGSAIALGMVGVGALPLDAVAAGKTKKVQASKAQVSQACQAAGGFEWGTEDPPPDSRPEDEGGSGRYGCITDNSWIECDANGDCEGGQAEARNPSRPGFGRAVTVAPGTPAAAR